MNDLALDQSRLQRPPTLGQSHSRGIALPGDVPARETPGRSPVPRDDLKEAQKSFLAVLGKHVPTEPQTPAEQSRETAEQLVSLSMIQPMLKQLRETNNAAPPFAPTQAEKQFRALTDADLAQRIVKAKHFPLVDRVAQVLLKRSDKLASGESVADAIAGATAASPMSPPAIDLKGKAP